MINAIVAIDQSQGIGLNGQMPWPHLKGDMSWFKKMTSGNVVIMGSTTWKSLGCKPLSNRINVVLSKTHHWSGEGQADHTFSDPLTAITFCENEYIDKEIFVIGGSAIYLACKPYISRYYITEIDSNYNCDTFFDFNFVKNNFTNIKEHAKFNDPVNYIIKEYNL